MKSAANDILDRLIELATISAGFVGEEPADPNNVVTIYDTGGSDPFADIELYTTSIQVRVRNVDYDTAYELQNKILKALIIPVSFDINETRYIGVWNVGDIMSLGKDSNLRTVLTTNYRIERQPL